MKNSKKPETKTENKKTEKKPYSSPKVTTESLMIYGAGCNGMSMAGGRKAAVADSCNSLKLHS
ncbi:MAG: hypothetical protein SGJ18_11855 [Pseudomonadota bacterium]|nr:hypothetical protein [Pseudomonadota bacterium]